MKKTLIIFAHPNFKDSKLNKALIGAAKDLQNVEVRDLYAIYENDIRKIDVKKEQERLLENERVIFEFPMYWFSANAMLKEWQDKVLEYGFAYGSTGDKLKGKELLIAITSGQPEENFQNGTLSLDELLSPFKALASFTGMSFGGCFTVGGSHNITDDALNKKTLEYTNLIKG